MTAALDTSPVCDAELVDAVVRGDQAAFGRIYDRYADRLYDYCVGIVGHRDAADCVQEAFCVAAVDLPALRDRSKLRPWLYAIARNQALRTLKSRDREVACAELPDGACTEPGPDVHAVRNEMAAMVTRAEHGLSPRDREVLDLVYRRGLSGPELAAALGVSTASAKKLVQRLRDTVARSLGALLVARRVNSGFHDCAALSAIVPDWGGEYSILLRKRISRHIARCPDCDEERDRLLAPTG
jgi:RNA polymerase sigma factor (sigma-70 family)